MLLFESLIYWFILSRMSLRMSSKFWSMLSLLESSSLISLEMDLTSSIVRRYSGQATVSKYSGSSVQWVSSGSQTRSLLLLLQVSTGQPSVTFRHNKPRFPLSIWMKYLISQSRDILESWRNLIPSTMMIGVNAFCANCSKEFSLGSTATVFSFLLISSGLV